MIIVNGFQLLTIITKRSILDVAAVLDPHLKLVFLLLIREFYLKGGSTIELSHYRLEINNFLYPLSEI